MNDSGSFGVNVIGFISGALALGTAGRATVRSLVQSNVPTRIVDVTLPGRSQADTTWMHLAADPNALPHPVNIWYMKPVEAASVRQQAPAIAAGRFNVIVPFWELPAPLPEWAALLIDFDLVLACSHFIASSLSLLTDVPLRHYPTGCETHANADRAQIRKKYGIKPDAFVFYTTFDLNSCIDRKNPMGALQAFRAAFGERDDVGIVFKMNGSLASPAALNFREMLSRVPQATVIESYLSYDEVLAITESCDAFVSLHRAEGLGYGPMEAMSLGKPVIATAFSGNMDYMDESNSLPVRYSLTPVRSRFQEYMKVPTLWAEPDVQHAAALMAAIVEDPQLARRIGEQGRSAIEARNAQFFSGGSVPMLRGAFEAWKFQRGAFVLPR